MPEPIKEGAVYGIRPHSPVSEAEAEERRRLNLAAEAADRPQADRCACGYCHSCNLQNPDCTCAKPVRVKPYNFAQHGTLVLDADLLAKHATASERLQKAISEAIERDRDR
ncbi:hypothetical protein [Nocardia wallacei]|uniref:Uncharacterized protein n=1 Tax=Nocardia wallacei TaxID=480035 RepID=A0A7G1KW19_9NOCA|nr:hypothetical protein [Nocardia wallacei]BCK58373.1 hypothetical protein NWFMUON74_61450 [Nocardia wallacei]